MTESKVETLVVKGHRGSMSARILIKPRRCEVCSTVLNPSSIELCQACRQDYPGDSA